MKKHILLLITLLLMLCSCSKQKEEKPASFAEFYNTAIGLGYEKSYEEWVSALDANKDQEIIDLYLDDNGDLIVKFNSETETNLGHYKHIYELKHDEANHYKECHCGEIIEKASHIWDLTGKTEASLFYTCSVCEAHQEVLVSADDFAKSFKFELAGKTIYEDVDLATIADYYGLKASISWSVDSAYLDIIKLNSDNTKVLVTPQEEEVKVKLKATFSFNGKTSTKEYEFSVYHEIKKYELIINSNDEYLYYFINVNEGIAKGPDLFVEEGSFVRVAFVFKGDYKYYYSVSLLFNGEIVEAKKVGEGYEITFDITTDTLIEFVFSNLIDYTPQGPEAGEVIEKASYDTLDDVASDIQLSKGLASSGDIEVLVIPIAFTNSKDYDLSIIEKAFNGTKEETGWNSLNSYYLDASFGKLNISANVLAPYNMGVDYDPEWETDPFKQKELKDYYDFWCLVSALDYYDSIGFDFSKYDSNNDGALDSIYLVYLAPYNQDSKLWWAYNYYYYLDNSHIYDGLTLDAFVWFSIEFLSRPIYDSDDDSKDVYVDANAEVIIHESGHALGLDDYYDTVNIKNPLGGLGRSSMMDSNQGDLDPFSKAILGWTNPTILFNQDYEITLKPFASTGDSLFIARIDNKSYFDEFYIITYYTPTGLNEYKKDLECGIYGISGVQVYHVVSVLKPFVDYTTIGEIYNYNNGGKDKRLIELVCAGTNDIDKTLITDSTDLFQVGDTLYISELGFVMTVSSITLEGAKISVEYTK